jgi:phosphocarrier protein HPr
MIEREITVQNRAGIHARPAAMIVQTASSFESKIMLGKDNEEINAKSIMGIITLGAAHRSVLKMTVEGPDEQEAADALSRLFENHFEEEPA